MSEIVKNPVDAAAFLIAGTNVDNMIVKAEDLPQENSGIDFKKHFFEPQVGKSYVIKFLPNLEGEALTHRSVYKALPDPKRKGKTFQYISSGNAKTCEVLQLFFDLYAAKKAGNALAGMKIDKYLSKTNQSCALIEVLNSSDKEEIGMKRMFTFSNFGPNATISNLINQKINPTQAQIDNDDAVKEDIYNVFASSVLMIECTETTLPDGKKGRDYAKSTWAKKPRGASVVLADGTIFEFKPEHLVNGKLTPEAEPHFMNLVAELQNPDLSVHNYFAYKVVDDPRNTKDTNDYLKLTMEKVAEIVPVIAEKSIPEIDNYGKGTVIASGADSAKTLTGESAESILKSSAPTEIMNSVLNAASENPITATTATGNKLSVEDVLNEK